MPTIDDLLEQQVNRVFINEEGELLTKEEQIHAELLEKLRNGTLAADVNIIDGTHTTLHLHFTEQKTYHDDLTKIPGIYTGQKGKPKLEAVGKNGSIACAAIQTEREETEYDIKEIHISGPDAALIRNIFERGQVHKTMQQEPYFIAYANAINGVLGTPGLAFDILIELLHQADNIERIHTHIKA